MKLEIDLAAEQVFAAASRVGSTHINSRRQLMYAIAPPQPTPTLRKRRIAMAIADFYFKCDRPSNFATPDRYATSANTSKERSPDLRIWAGGRFYG